jgi:hydroxymethylpyrimidine/phosphomethylpyrimidine kinase
MSERPKICLSIAGLDPSGGAGIIADVKTFSAFGCYGAAAVTSVTFQNTVGVFGAAHQTAESVRQQVEPVLTDVDVDAVKTGMLPTGEIIREVARLISENGLRNIVVDPVVRSTSGFDLIDNSTLRILIEFLFPLADIITPNLPEAERISGVAVESETDIEDAVNIMRSMGARNILIKGGHAVNQSRTARDYLFTADGTKTFESEYIQTTATHGTGCSLASAIVANLALGKELSEAVEISKRFVTEAIRTASNIGRGHSPINHLVKRS